MVLNAQNVGGRILPETSMNMQYLPSVNGFDTVVAHFCRLQRMILGHGRREFVNLVIVMVFRGKFIAPILFSR